VRVGEPCPVCGKPGPPCVNSRQRTCGSDCGEVYRARNTQARRDARYQAALQSVGIPARVPTFLPHISPTTQDDSPRIPVAGTTVLDSGIANEPVSDPYTLPPEPVAERTRPVPWEPVAQPVQPAAPGQRSGRYRRVLIWPDTHLPYADPRAVSLALQIGKYYQPDLVIMLGDILDCTGFSRFPHDQVNPKSFLQTELDEWHSLAESIREMAPHAERRFVIGNHEERIDRWLWSQPQLTGAAGFRLGNLLNLAGHGFAPEVEREVILCGGALTVTHGTRVGGQGAGLAARQEMQRHGTSGVSGHTHRLALVTQRDKAGLRQWIESGHLSLNPPHYQPSIQNWIQGITLGEVSVDANDFELRPVPFRLSYRALVDGREFSA
jgi:predicted phosphodiesterase/predicted nucleic acid-binding Zn ribbon protein